MTISPGIFVAFMEEQVYGSGLHPATSDFPPLSKPFVFYLKKYVGNLARYCELTLGTETNPQLTASKKVQNHKERNSVNS